MNIDRRELFRIIGAGLAGGPALAQHNHGGAAAGPDIASYKPRALSEAQYKALDMLCELLLPADEDGPGAHEAGVAFYLDTVLHYGPEARRAEWRAALDSAAASPEQAIARWAENEKHTKTEGEKFFVAFKSAAITAFYMSEAGKKSLGYKGDTAVASFPGCTHAGHHQG
jgi:hypothetical protein